MQSAMNQFNHNMKAVKEMETLYSYLINDPKLPPCDLSNILRAQWVYAVSALDKLIHELVKMGMLQVFVGKRPKTKKFNSFSMSLKTHLEIQEAVRSTNIVGLQTTGTFFPSLLQSSVQLQVSEYLFEQEIINKHKFLAFQEPDKIKDALSLIWEETHKWQKIAVSLNMSDDQVTKELKRIVTRRNQIVHEADIDLQTNLRGSMNETEVRETIEFILKLGESIFNAVNSSP